uniref:tetratricopeptide repeat protein n=1 Tax=uncultured Planktosalinus sp. TaxID=1810935 RepID=UPI0030DA4447
MRKNTGLFAFFLLYALIGFAQEQQIDSLETLLNQNQNDIEKAQALNTLAGLYITKSPEESFSYAQQALQLAQKINFTEAEGTAYINLGNYNIISGNYPEALEQFRMAKEVFEAASETGFKEQLARVYGSIGIVFSEQSSYDKALQYHLKALKIYENGQDRQRLARVYNNVGIVYKAQEDHFKALDYFIKAQRLQDSLNDPTIGTTTTNIGTIYLSEGQPDKAREYFTEAEEQFREHPNHRGMGELYNNLGNYYQTTGKKEKALESWNNAIGSFEKVKDQFGLSDTYYYLGGFYKEEQMYPEAIAATFKALELAREIATLEMLVLTEQQLQNIYEQTGDYQKALQHGKEYDRLKDSLISYQNIRKTVQAEMNFEFEKKEALHREQQQRQAVLLEEQSKRHRQQLLFGGMFLLLFAGLGFLFYNRNQLKKTLTLQKNLAEYEQKALHLQMNPHFVFNCLGSISSFIVQNGNDSAIKYLAKFSKLMRLTLEYSKEALIPVDKEIEALQNYLELEQLRFNKAFDFAILKDPAIEDDVALPPLLIQPFVENAIIHGMIPKKEHGMVTVDFSINEKHLICT